MFLQFLSDSKVLHIIHSFDTRDSQYPRNLNHSFLSKNIELQGFSKIINNPFWFVKEQLSHFYGLDQDVSINDLGIGIGFLSTHY